MVAFSHECPAHKTIASKSLDYSAMSMWLGKESRSFLVQCIQCKRHISNHQGGLPDTTAEQQQKYMAPLLFWDCKIILKIFGDFSYCCYLCLQKYLPTQFMVYLSYIQTYSHAHCIAYMDISEPNIRVCYLTNVQRYGQHVLSEFDGMVIFSRR